MQLSSSALAAAFLIALPSLASAQFAPDAPGRGAMRGGMSHGGQAAAHGPRQADHMRPAMAGRPMQGPQIARPQGGRMEPYAGRPYGVSAPSRQGPHVVSVQGGWGGQPGMRGHDVVRRDVRPAVMSRRSDFGSRADGRRYGFDDRRDAWRGERRGPDRWADRGRGDDRRQGGRRWVASGAFSGYAAGGRASASFYQPESELRIEGGELQSSSRAYGARRMRYEEGYAYEAPRRRVVRSGYRADYGYSYGYARSYGAAPVVSYAPTVYAPAAPARAIYAEPVARQVYYNQPQVIDGLRSRAAPVLCDPVYSGF